MEKLVTHDDKFHLDDILACTILMLINKDIKIIRTKDPKEFKNADYLVDVGGVYDPSTKKFDHHFRDGQPTWKNGVKYSAFGLIWKHFGEAAIFKIFPMNTSMDIIKKTWARIDSTLVEYVDKLDNGQATRSDEYICDLTLFVNEFAKGDLDDQFFKVVKICTEYLENKILNTVEYFPQLEKINEAIDYTRQNEFQILVLDEFLPWREAVIARNEDHMIKFVIFPDISRYSWRIQAVPPEVNSFDMLVPLPTKYAGKRGKDLVKACHLEDVIFVHPGKFIAGTKTRKSAILLALQALEIAGCEYWIDPDELVEDHPDDPNETTLDNPKLLEEN